MAGLLLEPLLVSYSRSIMVIAGANLVFALALWYADIRGSKQLTMSDMTFKIAILIGVAQAIALVPGTSRSGITITCALLLGLNRRDASEFSFLLAIPLISAASLFQGLRLLSYEGVAWNDLLLGTVLSAVAAYVCIALFLRIINLWSMLPFVVYRLMLAAALITLFSCRDTHNVINSSAKLVFLSIKILAHSSSNSCIFSAQMVAYP